MGRQSGSGTREALREKDAGAGSWESGAVVERAPFREVRISMSETPSTLPPARLCFFATNPSEPHVPPFFFPSLLIGAQFQYQISIQFPVRSEEGDTSHSVHEIPQRLPQASPWAPFLPSVSVCSKKIGSF